MAPTQLSEVCLPRFLLLPGLDGTGELLRDFADVLASLGPVEILRYPGDRPREYDALCDDLAAQAPIDGNCVLLAESFAGPLGIALAARATVPPRGLVLCASFAVSPLPWLRRLAPLTHWLPVHGVPRRLSDAFLLGRWATPRWSAKLDAAMRQVPAPVLRARLRAALCVDWRHELRALRCPVLYLQATADRVIPPYAARCIVAQRPDLVRVRIDGPHFLLQAAPHEAVEAIRRFLAERPGEPLS